MRPMTCSLNLMSAAWGLEIDAYAYGNDRAVYLLLSTLLDLRLQGLTSRRGDRDEQTAEKLASKYVYEVAATSTEEKGIGLAPPPEDLAAPWASRPQNSTDNSPAPRTHSKAAPKQAAAEQTAVARRSIIGGQEYDSPDQKAAAVLEKPSQTRVGQSVSKSAGTASTQQSCCPQTAVVSSNVADQAASSDPADLGSDLAEESSREYKLPPAIRFDQLLQREQSSGQAASESETPMSIAGYGLESMPSSGTVVVTDAHQAKLSLSLTASIEDYAKKADPANWGPPKFRKSQLVRVQPGT